MFILVKNDFFVNIYVTGFCDIIQQLLGARLSDELLISESMLKEMMMVFR